MQLESRTADAGPKIGIARYIVLAFAITLMVGGIFSNLISASIGAAGVGILALLGIVARFGDGGTAGHRAQWRHEIGVAA